MKLEDVMKAFDYNVSAGSEFLWKCYPNARYIDFNRINDSVEVGSVLFNTRTQEVYEANTSVAMPSGESCEYQWVNPEFKQARDDEAAERGVDYQYAFDDVRYITIESETEFLTIARLSAMQVEPDSE